MTFEGCRVTGCRARGEDYVEMREIQSREQERMKAKKLASRCGLKTESGVFSGTDLGRAYQQLQAGVTDK